MIQTCENRKNWSFEDWYDSKNMWIESKVFQTNIDMIPDNTSRVWIKLVKPSKDCYKSKNNDTIHPEKSLDQRTQMNRFRRFQNILIWVNMIQIIVYMKRFTLSWTTRNNTRRCQWIDSWFHSKTLKKSFARKKLDTQDTLRKAKTMDD